MASEENQTDSPGSNSKQKIITYAKLQSFGNAELKITELLRGLLPEDDVIIEKSESGKKPSLDAIGQTAAVVIDARQTRTLVTPERRDRNVDHWDELDIVSSKCTIPPGSSLIFIYGDEHSKNLEEGKIIADKWLTAWKFGDVHACSLAQNNRIFSLEDQFNKAQEEELEKYFQHIPLYPDTNKSVSVLLLGAEEDKKEIHTCLIQHPLLHEESKEDTEEHQHTSSYEYFKFKENPKSVPSIKLSCGILQQVKWYGEQDICDEVTSKFLTDHGISNKLGVKKYPAVDRLLLACHSVECFHKICNQLSKITKHMKKELSKVGISFTGFVLPVLSEHIGDDETVVKRGREIIISLKKDAKEKHLEEKERKLGETADEWVRRLYTYHAVQIPSKKLPKITTFTEGKTEGEEEEDEQLAPEDESEMVVPVTITSRSRFASIEKQDESMDEENVVTAMVETRHIPTENPQYATSVNIPDKVDTSEASQMPPPQPSPDVAAREATDPEKQTPTQPTGYSEPAPSKSEGHVSVMIDDDEEMRQPIVQYSSEQGAAKPTGQGKEATPRRSAAEVDKLLIREQQPTYSRRYNRGPIQKNSIADWIIVAVAMCFITVAFIFIIVFFSGSYGYD
ncbi:uncharacterized protein [Ptychodera flava]|uniref:uncharacterized protein n=1 Tax=Ptychodera flava TaxID=63121 RepID=UPI00396A69C3